MKFKIKIFTKNKIEIFKNKNIFFHEKIKVKFQNYEKNFLRNYKIEIFEI